METELCEKNQFHILKLEYLRASFICCLPKGKKKSRSGDVKGFPPPPLSLSFKKKKTMRFTE